MRCLSSPLCSTFHLPPTNPRRRAHLLTAYSSQNRFSMQPAASVCCHPNSLQSCRAKTADLRRNAHAGHLHIQLHISVNNAWSIHNIAHFSSQCNQRPACKVNQTDCSGRATSGCCCLAAGLQGSSGLSLGPEGPVEELRIFTDISTGADELLPLLLRISGFYGNICQAARPLQPGLIMQ